MKKFLATMLVLVVWIFILAAGCATEEGPTTVQPADPTGNGTSEQVPIRLVAERADAQRSVLSTGEPLSCAKVTVTNQTEENIDVNPLYFSMTDKGGTKHEGSSVLGVYENQIDTTVLAPGEKAREGGAVATTHTPRLEPTHAPDPPLRARRGGGQRPEERFALN